jgi:hypothetical protein
MATAKNTNSSNETVDIETPSKKTMPTVTTEAGIPKQSVHVVGKVGGNNVIVVDEENAKPSFLDRVKLLAKNKKVLTVAAGVTTVILIAAGVAVSTKKNIVDEPVDTESEDQNASD